MHTNELCVAGGPLEQSEWYRERIEALHDIFSISQILGELHESVKFEIICVRNRLF